MNTEDLVKLYIQEQSEIIKNFPTKDVARFCERIIQAYEEGKTVYSCGNGGNAASAANFITDLYLHPFVGDDKSKPLPESVKKMKAVNLVDSTATITGILNDLGAEFIFSQQIEGHIGKGDVIVGFSGSGNSSNILKAFEIAKKQGAATLGITRGDGGKMKNSADICIVIPGNSNFPGQVGKNNNNFHFEDYLSSISHMAVGILQKHVREKYGYR